MSDQIRSLHVHGCRPEVAQYTAHPPLRVRASFRRFRFLSRWPRELDYFSAVIFRFPAVASLRYCCRNPGPAGWPVGRPRPLTASTLRYRYEFPQKEARAAAAGRGTLETTEDVRGLFYTRVYPRRRCWRWARLYAQWVRSPPRPPPLSFYISRQKRNTSHRRCSVCIFVYARPCLAAVDMCMHEPANGMIILAAGSPHLCGALLASSLSTALLLAARLPPWTICCVPRADGLRFGNETRVGLGLNRAIPYGCVVIDGRAATTFCFTVSS